MAGRAVNATRPRESWGLPGPCLELVAYRCNAVMPKEKHKQSKGLLSNDNQRQSNINGDSVDIACRRCGSLGPHQQGPGAGPHWRRLVCGDCDSFIKWLRKPIVMDFDPEQYKLSGQVSMKDCPPTRDQVSFLKEMGVSLSSTASYQDAHEAIVGIVKRGKTA